MALAHDLTINLPYFTFDFEFAGAAPGLEQIMNLDMHVGFWADPATADATGEDFNRAKRSLTVELVGLGAPRDGGRILDVGCGFGGTVAYLNELLGAADLTGLNIDARQVERANRLVTPQAKPGSTVQFVQGEAASLPFPDATFDHIFAIECISHFSSRLGFFREAFRTLKPGGRLVLSDFVLRAPLQPLVGLIFAFYRRDVQAWFGDSRSGPTLAVYRDLCEESGLRLTKVSDVSRNIMPTWDMVRRAVTMSSVSSALEKVLGSTTVFLRANRFFETIMRIGACRYDLMVFQRPR